jgi:hypothetical protein
LAIKCHSNRAFFKKRQLLGQSLDEGFPHAFKDTLRSFCADPTKLGCLWEVRDFEETGRSKFLNDVEPFTYDKNGPVYMKILLHYRCRPEVYLGKCPSYYIVKKYMLSSIGGVCAWTFHKLDHPRLSGHLIANFLEIHAFTLRFAVSYSWNKLCFAFVDILN